MTDIANPIGLDGNYQRWVACSRKQVYAGLKIAKDVAARIRRRGGPKMLPYRCAQCGSYHLATGQTNRAGKT